MNSFLYYLLVQTTISLSQTHHQVIGFFSKEKMSWDNNNLACILVFPPWQRKGMGKILMGVSYELSKREGRVGGPEKRMLYFQYYPFLPSLLALKPPPDTTLRHAKLIYPQPYPHSENAATSHSGPPSSQPTSSPFLLTNPPRNPPPKTIQTSL